MNKILKVCSVLKELTVLLQDISGSARPIITVEVDARTFDMLIRKGKELPFTGLPRETGVFTDRNLMVMIYGIKFVPHEAEKKNVARFTL